MGDDHALVLTGVGDQQVVRVVTGEARYGCRREALGLCPLGQRGEMLRGALVDWVEEGRIGPCPVCEFVVSGQKLVANGFDAARDRLRRLPETVLEEMTNTPDELGSIQLRRDRSNIATHSVRR